MGVGLLQVLAGAGDVKSHSHHLDTELLSRFQQVPAALQRKAKGHAGFSCVGLGVQLQQQSTRYEKGTSASDQNVNENITSRQSNYVWTQKMTSQPYIHTNVKVVKDVCSWI